MASQETASQETIAFYGEERPYFELSNFYPSPITLDGKEWATTEHYYQAQKTVDPVWQEKVRTAATPGESKELGRASPDYDDDYWLAQRDEVMRRALHAKFTQHDELRALLLATGEKLLVEDSPDDRYWGTVNGDGVNRLGKLLMALRAEL